ncbi:MAG: BatA domain-containing protein, partial [Lentisphaeria bacterium]|nr:BatA domain-containing protein [Lentisphaeria bacterium]
MFEQLFILWGLPLILIPLIVHLLNRLRFKSLDWAAMSFLLSASKESTKHQKLKQFLILLFRILALLCLIFALSRPKVGGLLAMTFSSPPDTILVLFDRSQSMENIDSHSSKTQRNIALEKLINTIREVPGSPRIILIDSLLKEAVEIDDAELLSKHPYLQKTNSSADWPSIMQSAWQYLTDNESGKTEIWISTDLQSASWKKESKRWETILEQFKELKKVTEIKFISQSLATNKNQGIEILDVKLFEKNKALFLELSFALHKNYQETKTLPMRVNIANDELKTFDIELSTERQIFRQQFEIENRNATWGTITLPNDGNLADNKAYFVFEEESAQKISIVSDNPGNARVLQLLSAPPISMNEASTFTKTDLNRAFETKPALLIIEGLVEPSHAKEIKD